MAINKQNNQSTLKFNNNAFPINDIYIGDNLTILSSSILNKYVDSIKMIYIDPPYNTKSLKSYNDKKRSDEWLDEVSNTIKSSYKYLKDDGVIFISIDDNEYAYLKVECDKIFGRNNFIGTFITYQSQRSNSKLINITHEYIICYAKNREKVQNFKIKRISIPEQKEMIITLQSEVNNSFKAKGLIFAQKLLNDQIKLICDKYKITWLKNYSNIDENGNIYFAKDLSTPSDPRELNIPCINLYLAPLPTRGWSSSNKFIDLHNRNLLVYKGGRPYEKHYLLDAEDNAPSILNFYSRQGTNDLNKLDLRGLFDTPKSVELLKFLIRISSEDCDIIMDYYAGSGSTGQAVMEVNVENNSNLKFILIQRDEVINTSSPIYKNCLKYGIRPSVSEILKLRIDTVINKLNLNIKYEIHNKEQDHEKC